MGGSPPSEDDARLSANAGKNRNVTWTPWERRWDAVADVPWGLIAFAAIATLEVAGAIAAADVTTLGTAAGLLGVGHGLHTGSKHLGGRGRR
jgi:hypothetical protein